MTTKDMLQILINGQDALNNGFSTLQKGFGALHNRFDTLQNRFDTLQNGFGALHNRFDTLQNGFDTLQNGQNELKKDLAILREETRNGFRKSHERLDKQGKQLAYLDDDAPTRKEHDGLVTRVEKIEKVISS